MLNQKYIVNPKIQYNYNNINCIPELLLAYSVVVDGGWNGVNILVNHKCDT